MSQGEYSKVFKPSKRTFAWEIFKNKNFVCGMCSRRAVRMNGYHDDEQHDVLEAVVQQHALTQAISKVPARMKDSLGSTSLDHGGRVTVSEILYLSAMDQNHASRRHRPNRN